MFLSAPADLAETRARMLGELAELGLVLARDLQQAALTAEEPQDKVRLAEAFARVGRGVRQSLALHARMAREAMRDAAEAAVEAAVEAARLEPAQRSRRKAQLRAAVETLIWREHERLDADPDLLLGELDACLDDEAEGDGFLHDDPEVLIARLCRMLELPIPSANDGGGPIAADRTAQAAPEPAGDPPHDRAAQPGGFSQGVEEVGRRSSA